MAFFEDERAKEMEKKELVRDFLEKFGFHEGDPDDELRMAELFQEYLESDALNSGLFSDNSYTMQKKILANLEMLVMQNLMLSGQLSRLNDRLDRMETMMERFMR